jgi:uncharacterized protein
MIKYLLLLAVVFLAFWWLRRGRGGDESARKPRQEAPGGGHRKGAPGPAEPTPMLACAHCGVHLPRAEAVSDADGRAYCGEAHRLAGPR